MSTLSKLIRQKALEIGFAAVGITPAEMMAAEGSRLGDWLARGYQGNMAWLEREPEKRSDPTVLMPGARSVVAVAMNYYFDREHVDSPTDGKISRYAWGDDYHDLMRSRLEMLAAAIREAAPNVNAKICVDTAPMMDKAWAVRAGLGWIGKHTNVITMDYGSWVFLGEIVLDVALDYDTEVIPDHCGTCTKCLDACPTGAIVEPYVVDSRKCISYATIELREESLPPEIAENLNGWFYGCDICQDVCPWNRFETPTTESAFEPRSGETEISLDEVLAMTPESYAARFRRTAIKRAKLPGLKRNAAALKSTKLPD